MFPHMINFSGSILSHDMVLYCDHMGCFLPTAIQCEALIRNSTQHQKPKLACFHH